MLGKSLVLDQAKIVGVKKAGGAGEAEGARGEETFNHFN
jgi:hypothetical protein